MTGAIGAGLAPAPGFTLPIQIVTAAGITAWLVEDQSLPIVALAWSWRGGAGLDANGGEGAASMMAALLTEGAGPLDAVAYSDAFRDIGATLGFTVGRDQFEGRMRCLAETLPEAARLTRLAMVEPRFDTEAVERVRARAIASARRSLETPGGQASRAFFAAIYPGHPAGRPSAGTAESLAGIPVAALRASLATQLRRGGPDGAGAPLVTAAGAITPARLVALIEELFGALPAGAPPALPPLPAWTNFGRKVVPIATPQSTVIFGQDGLSPDDPDWEATQVMLRVLGAGSFGSRLMEAVREQRGLAYGISADLDLIHRRGVILGSVATANARVGETLTVTRDEWARMAAGGPTETEMEDAVAFMTGALPLQFADTGSIARGLLTIRQNNRAPEWLAGRPARLRALTRDRLAAVAARLLRPDGLSVIVAGEPEGL